MLAVTAAEMRALDRLTIERYGTPGHVLMERAGAGAARVFWQEFPHVRAKPVVVAGKGNNGGDGFVVARHLRGRRVRCDVVLLARAADVGGDAARHLRAFQRRGGRVIEAPGAGGIAAVRAALERSRVVIDAIFGTGLNAPVAGPTAEIIELINASGVPVFSIDIPSGLDADTGQPLGTAVQAEATATFGFPKVGQLLFPGARYVGTLVVVDIGIAAEAVGAVAPTTRLLCPSEVGPLLAPRPRDAHKGDAGHVLIVAGGRGKCGAAMLAARGAVRSGAGLTTLALPASEQRRAASTLLEVMTASLADAPDGLFGLPRLPELDAVLAAKDSVVAGPGIGVSEGSRALIRALVRRSSVPLVLDADGLNCIADDPAALRARSAPAVLTPHPGEMSRLCGRPVTDIQANRLAAARELAGRTGTYVVLKGARTVIAAPDGRALINATGNPGMASGGMGDVLAGVIGAFCAQGLAAFDAAALGVFVHGAAADLAARALGGEIGITASDVIDALPRAIAETQAAAYAQRAGGRRPGLRAAAAAISMQRVGR
jgi:NAD(P)H-hydrate epimerase